MEGAVTGSSVLFGQIPLMVKFALVRPALPSSQSKHVRGPSQWKPKALKALIK